MIHEQLLYTVINKQFGVSTAYRKASCPGFYYETIVWKHLPDGEREMEEGPEDSGTRADRALEAHFELVRKYLKRVQEEGFSEDALRLQYHENEKKWAAL